MHSPTTWSTYLYNLYITGIKKQSPENARLHNASLRQCAEISTSNEEPKPKVCLVSTAPRQSMPECDPKLCLTTVHQSVEGSSLEFRLMTAPDGLRAHAHNSWTKRPALTMSATNAAASA